MALRTSSTGSWPPLYDPNQGIAHLNAQEQELIVRQSIERAIQDQITLGLDVLVDGQVRDDIISLFARKLPGYEGQTLPYGIVGPVCPAAEPITVNDYQYAKQWAGGKPLKAHLTGPMTMARNVRVLPGSGYKGRNDPNLVLDLARALGHEASLLVQAGAEIVQIDEPVLASVKDLGLAFEALQAIVEFGRIPFPALHVCADVTGILGDILAKAPVKMVSIEGRWLDQPALSQIDSALLAGLGKQLGLGCIRVDDHAVEKRTQVQSFLGRILRQVGEDSIWGVMPNCGLRPLPHQTALEKLRVMVEAVRQL